MIDITDQLVSVIKGIVGSCTRSWPQKAPKGPFATVDLAGRSVETVADDGSEVVVRLTYTVSIWASKPSVAADLAGEVADALAEYSLHTAGWTPVYEDANHLYRVNVTFQGAIDKRGQTFL